MPTSLVAGATWEWTQHCEDAAGDDFAPGGGTAVTFYLSGLHSLSFAASDNGDGQWLFLATDEQTTAVKAGVYRWHILGTLSGKVYSLGYGVVEVSATPVVTVSSDQRTFAEKMLAAVEAELLARVPGTGAAVNSFGIGTRQFEKVPLEQLQKMRAQYAAEVAVEQYGKLPDVEAYFVRA
jgi:hypothetical protein